MPVSFAIQLQSGRELAALAGLAVGGAASAGPSSRSVPSDCARRALVTALVPALHVALVSALLEASRVPRAAAAGAHQSHSSSGEARGDLFRSLPAYGKFHPE